MSRRLPRRGLQGRSRNVLGLRVDRGAGSAGVADCEPRRPPARGRAVGGLAVVRPIREITPRATGALPITAR
jgi:hypothetical protein